MNKADQRDFDAHYEYWDKIKKPTGGEMRREVKWFAEKMEEILLHHDKEKGSDGWKGEDVIWILDRINFREDFREVINYPEFSNVYIFSELAPIMDYIFSLV